MDGLIEKGEKKEIAIMHTIQKYIVDSKKVLLKVMGTVKSGHRKLKDVDYQM